MKRASFDISKSDGACLWIVDTWQPNRGQLTVTNDAEKVVEVLHVLYPGARIIYRDTGGQWAELVHDGPTFIGFGPVPSELRTEGMP